MKHEISTKIARKARKMHQRTTWCTSPFRPFVATTHPARLGLPNPSLLAARSGTFQAKSGQTRLALSAEPLDLTIQRERVSGYPSCFKRTQNRNMKHEKRTKTTTKARNVHQHTPSCTSPFRPFVATTHPARLGLPNPSLLAARSGTFQAKSGQTRLALSAEPLDLTIQRERVSGYPSCFKRTQNRNMKHEKRTKTTTKARKMHQHAPSCTSPFRSFVFQKEMYHDQRTNARRDLARGRRAIYN